MKNLISFLIRHIPRRYLQRVAGLGLRILSVAYQGNAVMCPVCKNSFRKFLPYGRINPRPNALCPVCMSLERHRLLWLYLNDKTKFFTEKSHVLHIAPEACFISQFEKLHGENYITADIESPLAKVKMDIHKIPFEDNTFDAVLCNHVLEHVRDDIKAMKEIHRVLKPHGFAILQVPFFHPIPEITIEDSSITNPKARAMAFGQDDHVRKYGKDYSERIQRAGLETIEDDYASTLSSENTLKFGISKREIIYKAIKP